MSEVEAVQLLENNGAGSVREDRILINPRKLSTLTLKAVLVALSIKYEFVNIAGTINAIRRAKV